MQVLAVRLRKDRIAVALEHKVLVYNFADLRLLHAIETLSNPTGLLALSPSADAAVLACPGLHAGQVRGARGNPRLAAACGPGKLSRKLVFLPGRCYSGVFIACCRVLCFFLAMRGRFEWSSTTPAAPSSSPRTTPRWRRWRSAAAASCWPRPARRARWCAGLAASRRRAPLRADRAPCGPTRFFVAPCHGPF